MKRKLSFAALCAAVLVVPWPAVAGDWYAGGGIGRSELDRWCRSFSGSCDDADIAYKLMLGYQFRPNFALEAAYHDFGNFSARGPRRSEQARALSTSGIGRLPLTAQFAVFAKAGLAWVETRRADGANLIVGIGASYRPTPLLELRLEYEMLPDAEFKAARDADINVLGAAATYRF
jgi:OOP family OmpA-OmpF porin